MRKDDENLGNFDTINTEKLKIPHSELIEEVISYYLRKFSIPRY